MANLLDLSFMPSVQENILQHLAVREIKALRLACRETHDWVNKANVKHRWGGVSTKVDLKRKGAKLTLDTLATLPFTVTDLTLLNYWSPDLIHVDVTGRFLERKGPAVKTLRVDKFFGCRYDDELVFMERLSGLQELFVRRLELESKFYGLQDHSLRIPPTIRQLQTLSFQNQICSRATIQPFWEFASAPRHTTVLMPPVDFNLRPEEFLRQVLLTLQHRSNLEDEEKVNYTHVDLSALSFSLYAPAVTEMRQFLAECYDNNVRVLNVPPIFLVDYYIFIYKASIIQEVQGTVESILGWHWALKEILSATLKELRIPSTNRPNTISGLPETCDMDETYSIPNLQLLHVTFDTRFDNIRDVTWCADLIRTLHLGPVCMPQSRAHPNGNRVTELSVTFLRDPQNKTSLTPPGVICPAAIGRHYPNIRILKITGWDAHDIHFIRLWKGLHCLEEVHIDDCRNLSDAGFIDVAARGPVFLKYKGRLRKLTLKLNNMPKITDHLFRNVISHLPLEEFYLHTKRTRLRSSKSLSRKALKYLANGPFGSSVKKFPFDTFFLTGTTAAEQKRLKFRFPTVHF